MKVEINDIVKVNGREYEVEKVLHCEFWDGNGYDAEFIDTNGHYHHWKQEEDGGELIKVMPRHVKIGEFEGGIYRDSRTGRKMYGNSQGTDCTDLLKKYGMI